MNVKEEIAAIRERNARVELDKAWETSWTRRAVIVLFTYLLLVIFFYSAHLPRPWVNAIVPSIAFLLSTLTLPFFKKLWTRKRTRSSRR
ncbi:hypothetical protein J4419_04475 [Candidatus Woesearchaeota archaeon]|nr:hypothetical protein [Candidatus Woesearchaeota archaeon]